MASTILATSVRLAVFIVGYTTISFADLREESRLSIGSSACFDEILKDYPSLSADQLRAVVAFAAATAKEDLPLLAAPAFEETQTR